MSFQAGAAPASGDASGSRGLGVGVVGSDGLIAELLGGSAPRAQAWAKTLTAERSLGELARWGAAEFVHRHGVEPGPARRLAAAFELARRTWDEPSPQPPSLRTPRRVFELVRPRLRGRRREVLLNVLLDSKHRLRRCVQVSEGTLTSSLVHPREVFCAAVREGAAALICVHNHPSGDPEPSAEDLAITRRLAAAGRLLGIPLVDHVVVGSDSFCSIRERMGSGWSAADPDYSLATGK